MKGVKLEQAWQVELVDLPHPQPKSDEALIRVRSVGICGSDIGAYRGANPLVSYPRVIGHEIAGEIVTIPENNPKGLQVGDRVVVDPYIYCGKCYPCSIGRTNCCESLRVLGVHVDGGMTEYFAHPAHLLYKAPDNIPWDILPIVEPLVIALHGLGRARLKAGEHLAIFGAGPIGLLEAMAALAYGATPIVIDPVDGRLADAKSMGVEHVINPVTENLVERVMQYTKGRGAEVVLEASGANAAIASTLDIVSFAGRIVLTGWPKQTTELPTAMITRKEVDILGGRTGAGEFPEALRLMQENLVDTRKILTRTVTVDEAPDMVKAIEANPAGYLKVNVLFG